MWLLRSLSLSLNVNESEGSLALSNTAYGYDFLSLLIFLASSLTANLVCKDFLIMKERWLPKE